MSSNEKNARAQTAAMYHRGIELDPERFVQSCLHESFASDSEHLDFHRPELYALLAGPVNECVETTLSLREVRAPFGLIRPGSQAVTKLDSDISGILNATLTHDVITMLIEDNDMDFQFSKILRHMIRIDPTSKIDLGHLITGGIHTMTSTCDSTYDELLRLFPEADSTDLKSHWRIVFDQACINIKDIILLDRPGQILDELYILDDKGGPVFCQHALRQVIDLAHVADRETIGCPLTFRPDLVRELWEWYVDLRGLAASTS